MKQSFIYRAWRKLSSIGRTKHNNRVRIIWNRQLKKMNKKWLTLISDAEKIYIQNPLICSLMLLEASKKDDAEYKLPRFGNDSLYRSFNTEKKIISDLTEAEFSSFRDKLVQYLTEYRCLFSNCVKNTTNKK